MSRLARLKDGSVVELRPLEPSDAELLTSGFETLSEATRYERFFTAVPTLPKHWVNDLLDIDHRDREALGATIPGTTRGIGVARYVRLDDDPDEADFAVTITDAWQGRGLGRVLMEELVAAARANGLRRLSADILAENEPMIGLARTLGRSAEISLPDEGVVHAVIEL